MPLRSRAQMRYLFAVKPSVAKRWAGKTSRRTLKRLPERLHRNFKRKLVGRTRRRGVRKHRTVRRRR